MPRVGKKKFPYTKQGVADAKAYAKKNDLPIIYTEDNKAGMSIPGYAEGGGVRFYERQAPAASVEFHKPEQVEMASSGSGRGKPDGEDDYVEPTECPEGQEPDGQGGCRQIEDDEVGDDTPCPKGQEPDGQGGCKQTEEDPVEEDPIEEDPIEEDPVKKDPDPVETDPEYVPQTQQTSEELNKKIYGPRGKPQTTMTREELDKKAYGKWEGPQSQYKGDEYIPQSTFGEGENPNINRPEGSYSHEARNMVPATQKPKIQLPKSDTGGGDGLASKLKGDGDGLASKLQGGGDGESLADKIKDKTSGGGGGGGLASLGETIKEKAEDVTDEVSAKKGAVVKANKKKQKLTPLQLRARDFLNKEKANRAKKKTNTPGRKMHKGGKVKANKKGMAIIIAIGKPKVNRKKK